MEKRLVFGSKRPGGRNDQIGAEQRPRLVIDRSREAVAKRSDAHQGGDAQRDRNGKQQQPSPARPAIAPRHFPDEGVDHETISPLRRRTVRSVRRATSASCVTSTSAVPALRFRSNITSMTELLVSASRFPVGSSAKRIFGR